MLSDPLFLSIAIFCVLLVGVSKAGFGGALGSLSVPLLSLTIPSPQAAAIMLPILLILDAVGLRVFRGQGDKANLRIIIPGAMLGFLLGALFFHLVDIRWIKGIIGTEAFLFGLDRLRQPKTTAEPGPPDLYMGLFWSGISGFTSFISHAGGPPILQYLLPQGLERTRMVGTTVIFFSVVNFSKLIPYSALGLLDLSNLMTSAMLLTGLKLLADALLSGVF